MEIIIYYKASVSPKWIPEIETLQDCTSSKTSHPNINDSVTQISMTVPHKYQWQCQTNINDKLKNNLHLARKRKCRYSNNRTSLERFCKGCPVTTAVLILLKFSRQVVKDTVLPANMDMHKSQVQSKMEHKIRNYDSSTNRDNTWKCTKISN